ncbi:Nucleoporin nup184 [Escovopsis weberi]|uniref:Nucleoporin NUP188 n=1 Tax=Escovopsis weberi TaxID=150374 RepID=A0A0M8MYY4_ESCWE|nr:Nucleoporin nup184 [Escovopsis weberi]
MAPVSDRNYFPSLEECLTGEKVLLSWKLIATALSDSTGQRQSRLAVVKFLNDDYVRQLLADPATAFAPPSDASDRDFKTKTAPINVASVSGGTKFDINQIKDDAQWLSRSAKVNLVAALRVAVVEHQARPTNHLLGPLSSQDAANLQDATGLQNGQGSALLAEMGASTALDADEISAHFDSDDARRRRLFDTLLTERRFLMMAADYAASIKLYGCLPIFTDAKDSMRDLYGLQPSAHARDDTEALLGAYLQVFAACVNSIESGVGSVTDNKLLLDDDDVQLDWLRSYMTEAIHALSVVLQLIDSYGSDIPPSSVINQWFSLMERYDFFDSLQPIHESIVELINPLKTLTAAISLGLLKPARALAYLTDRDEEAAQIDDLYDSYLLSSDVLEQIHKSVVDAAGAESETASPVIFAWSFLLHRLNVSYQNRTEKRDNLLQQRARENFESGGVIRPSSGRRNSAGSIFSIESSKFDGFLENASTPRDMQVVEQLAAGVTAHGKVFDIMSKMVETLGPAVGGSMTPLLSSRVRVVFLELLKVSYPFVGYQSDSVSCLLSLLSPGRGYWDLSASKTLPPSQDILASMINDDHAMNFYFQQAIDRYPYEFLPFISLCRILCTATDQLEDDRLGIILKLLRKTPTLTFSLPDSFQGYELVQEDENTNSFCLLEDIPLISLSSSWSRRFVDDDAYRIPTGSYGRFITDTGRVVEMEYQHSTLSLLGRQLEINLAKEGYCCELGMLRPDEVAEAILLLATLLRTEQIKRARAASDTSNTLVYHDEDLISEFSRHISGGKDIVNVVCDTMDYYMQDELAMTEDVAVNILSSCVKFLHAVLWIQPTRVWSYLAKSELINSDSRAGKLTKITGSLDLISERFEFLASSLSLFSELIGTVTSSAVQRRVGNKTASRQQAETNPWIGMADNVLSRVSFSIAQTSVDVFENTSTWMFESDISRVALLREVIPILNRIILCCYSMGDSSSSDHLTSALAPAAAHIVDCFLSSSSSTGSLRFQPILSSCLIALSKTQGTLYPGRTEAFRSEVESILRFSSTLLRVASYLEQPSATLESYLFKSSTLLARLCAASDHFREPALSLLQSLVSNAGQAASEPPSLLGYLGPQISKSFLQVLATIGQPFDLDREVKTTWTFFSSILRNRQQWMSNCLLTGQTPREAMKTDDKKKEASADSVFATALSKLRHLKSLRVDEALVVLDFVASAQNYWPWTVFTLQKDTTYMDGLRSYVRELKPSSVTVKSNGVRASKEARVAAYVAETFAMQLYHARHLGNAETLARSLVNDLDYYLRDGVEVSSYNKSLHNNFSKNFGGKYFGCSLDSFKRTLLEPRELGEKYYYDLDRADAMLNFDPGWLGKRENGFQYEMKLANANLSLVDAQIALFHAWEFLLLELSACLPDIASTKRQMMQVAQQCLNANQGIPGPESIFLKIVDARADLALILIQRLVKSGLAVADANQLLAALVGTINGVEEPFAPDTISYYRTLLKALFMVLRAYQVSETRSLSSSQLDLEGSTVSVTQTILNVLDTVVMGGFRSLISLIHDRDLHVLPEDLALLTAILQASLGMPSIEQSQTQVLNIMASHDVVHAASSLYSWSDKLAEQGDPVYGELSIMFLLELSTLPMVAEQLASDGILGGILSANLTKFMLRSNVSPYADAPIAQRCYGIWVKGLLPLMLNLLASLGATVAPEITYVLNQFPHLLQASVDRFEAPGASRTKEKTASQYLTLLGTSEVHSLALLTRILAALRMNNSRDISAVEWDATGLLENVEYWLSSRRLLKERLLPLGPREMEWRARKLVGTSAGECDNVLEEKIVAQLETVRDVLSEEFDG